MLIINMYNNKAAEMLCPLSKSISEVKENEIKTHEKFKTKKIQKKVMFNSLINQFKKNQRSFKDHKRDADFNQIIKNDVALKWNLINNFEENKAFSSSCQIKEKENMTKYYCLIGQTYLSKAKINFALAEQIVNSLLSINDFDSIKISCLNKIDFNAYKELRGYIEYFMTEEIKELLYIIALESKKSDLVNLAASNAVTLLNKSGFHL